MVKTEEEQIRENFHAAVQQLSQMCLDNFENLPRQMTKIREDQVQNKAGGYVFEVDDRMLVRRFLILGTTTATYYTTEKEATKECLDQLIKIIEHGKGAMVLEEIVNISAAGTAPKQTPLFYVLALCARYEIKDRVKLLQDGQGGPDKSMQVDKDLENLMNAYKLALQRTAFLAVNKVCNIPTHLFTFIKYAEKFSTDYSKTTGWGRGMRKAITEWYMSRSPEQLAMHITKYKNREGYTHRDVLRLAHPQASQNKNDTEDTLIYDQIFHFACTGSFDEDKRVMPTTEDISEKRKRCDYALTEKMIENEANSKAIELLKAADRVSKLTDSEEDAKTCAQHIRQYGLVREHIPTNLLNSVPVWQALLEKMPMTALIRNLSKLSSLGLIDGKNPENKKYVDMVVNKVTDEALLHKAKIHPISVLLASSVYTAGHGMKGSLKWEVNPEIKAALDSAFILAFKNVEPTGRRYLLAYDVSGSMSQHISGGMLSCREASTAMGAVFLRTEPKVECMAFETGFVPLPFTKEMSINEMVEYTAGLAFGGTDCSQPMLWAAKENKEFDVFMVFTDNETWAGDIQPFEALQRYRTKMNIPDAKLVVFGMSATQFTIADPTDPGMLDVVGLDSSVPELVRNFVLGEL
ncbi:TROVE domain-containing protein [Ditylenchus destructor]|uniref:TROVE domain-containing protein n=1 Tax=Ditylenchus destructor TaxID=166010 RepID=A0AAD4R3Z9_9BILA|nr:TROVE domain-containing protein [Ditylenchus destructor]